MKHFFLAYLSSSELLANFGSVPNQDSNSIFVNQNNTDNQFYGDHRSGRLTSQEYVSIIREILNMEVTYLFVNSCFIFFLNKFYTTELSK